MHVKSREQNRPAYIMERNIVREARRAVSGLGAALRASSMSATGGRDRPVTLLTDTTCMDGELTYRGRIEWGKTGVLVGQPGGMSVKGERAASAVITY